MKEGTEAAGFCIVMIGIIVGFFIGTVMTVKMKQDEAIKAGFAYYNTTNAVFTWKTNLVEQGE